MAEQKNAPQIRVAGFTVEWTKQLLNHYLETSQEKNIDGIYKEKMFCPFLVITALLIKSNLKAVALLAHPFAVTA